MNPIEAQQALKVASSLWGQFNKYRKEKAAQAYSALEEAASNVKENADNFSDDAESNFSEARKQAGAVTKAAHDRIERALAEFSSRGEEASELPTSATAQKRPPAQRVRRHASRPTRPPRRRKPNASSWKRPRIRTRRN